VSVVSEQTQTQYLQEAAQKYFACDPTVATVNLFLLVDESTRDGKDASGAYVGGGWQSGLLTAGGPDVSQPKLAYTALAPVFAAGRAACHGPQIVWVPKTDANGSSGGSAVGHTKSLRPLCRKGQRSTKLKPCRKQ
jgi:hypothetical protein